MAKPKGTTTRTFVCRGRLNDDRAHAVLRQHRVQAGVLYDAAIDDMTTNHPLQVLNGNQSQKLATAVSQQLGISKGPLNNRCRIAIVGNAANAHNQHAKQDAGPPAKYDSRPVRTIETFAHGNRHQRPLVILHRADNRQCHGVLHIPGFPSIQLTCNRTLPQDQPTYASVSVKERRVTVQLTYRIKQQALPPSHHWDPHDVLGIDLGITELIATSAGLAATGVKQQKLQAKIKRALRVRSAMVRKAIRNKRTGYRPVLDEHNVQVRTATDRPKRKLVWLKWQPHPYDKERKILCEVDQPPKDYRKASQCVSRLLKQSIRQRKSYRHQVAAAIVKHCLAHGIQLIAVEKLQIQNLTKSNRGTVSNPGKNVAQKRSLNRRILEQGWAELLEYIKYKARYRGIRLLPVNPIATSQTCSQCGHRNKKSRQGKQFHCTKVDCGYQADADANAAANIGDRGTYYFLKRYGVTLDDVRQRRLCPPLPSTE